jgi:hypothetical protein
MSDPTVFLDREECALPVADDALFNLPGRVRDIATLRGLGYSCLEIGRRLGITPQAVSVTLVRYRRRAGCFGAGSEMLELSSRAANALARIGIGSRDDARSRDVFALLGRERNCGTKTLDEIRRWLDCGEDGPRP